MIGKVSLKPMLIAVSKMQLQFQPFSVHTLSAATAIHKGLADKTWTKTAMRLGAEWE